MLDSPNSKKLGAYYTPPKVVQSLVRWGTKGSREHSVLDPSCGDGRFLEGLENAFGVDVDPNAARAAESRPNRPTIVNDDFFGWAKRTEHRFHAAVGNPPFIRYQRFNGETRARALDFCKQHGVNLTGLSSSWAAFIVGAASLLREGGRIGFVVPAEIGHAVYARPIVQYLLASFERVEIIAIREKLFPGLSEDCWLLRARGFGRGTTALHFLRLDRFDPDESRWSFESVSISELKYWQFRLRPLLLAPEIRECYRALAQRKATVRLGSIAKLGIGYVTGANEFFHLRPSVAAELGIPREYLRVTVRTNRDLAVSDIDRGLVADWLLQDRPVLLLDLAGRSSLPKPIRSYLGSAAGREARTAFKCRNRSPWYAVPDVRSPGAFLSIMSSIAPRLVANTAGAVCTNSVHAIRFADGVDVETYLRGWGNPLTSLSCEVEGHALGGGLLKIEPSEARQILLSPRIRLSREQSEFLSEGLLTLRRWRNINVAYAT